MKILGGNATLHVEVRRQRYYIHWKRYSDGWHVWCAGDNAERTVGPLPTWATAYRAGLRLAEKLAKKMAPKKRKKR